MHVVTIRIMLRTGECTGQTAITAFKIEVDSIEIGTDRMIAHLTTYPRTPEFHADFLQTELALPMAQLILDNRLEQGGRGDALAELDVVVLDLG